LANCIRVSLDLPGLKVLGQREQQGQLLVDVAYETATAICPHCRKPTAKVHEWRRQRKRDLPLRGQQVILVLWRRRFRCLWCMGNKGRPRTFSESDPVCGVGPGGRGRRTTARLREKLGQEPPHQTIKRTAQVYGVSQRLVGECFVQGARDRICRSLPKGQTPRVLGLDEFSMKRGLRYETIICDLEAPRVLEVIAGRAGQSVRAYLDSLGEPERVRVVVMDMSEAYRQVVWLCLPRAVIVVDRFHVLRRVGRALDGVRLRLQRRPDEEDKAKLFELRYALLRDPTAWTHRQREGVEKLMCRLPQLRQAWQRKERFVALYDSPDRATAEARLSAWEEAVKADGFGEYRALFAHGSMLGSWRQELLNYFDHRFTNGYVEGKNNRSKQLQRQAYGYRNRDNLRLRILLPAA
jgi:transposase